MNKLYLKYLSIVDKVLPIGGLVRKPPYMMIFKTTNFCWYKCPHCCENSGSNQQKTYIPLPVIKDYLSQALKDPYFSKEAIFTGGEIMSSYLFGDKNYVPDLLTFCQNKGIRVDIKTNAAWVNAGFGKEVFDDLAYVLSNGEPYSVQISLSLDRFHENSVKNCAKVIKSLSEYKNIRPMVIHLATFKSDEYLYKELCSVLRGYGKKVQSVPLKNGGSIDVVDKKFALGLTSAILFDGGRAKNLPEAQKTQLPQFKFLSNNLRVLIAFDNKGLVTLGENCGRKISTNWRDKDGGTYSLPIIRKKLLSGIHREEIMLKIRKKMR